MDEDCCQHVPTLKDRLWYYLHIIVEPCRFTGDSELLVRACLTADWLEMGVACPDCLIDDVGDDFAIHPS